MALKYLVMEECLEACFSTIHIKCLQAARIAADRLHKHPHRIFLNGMAEKHVHCHDNGCTREGCCVHLFAHDEFFVALYSADCGARRARAECILIRSCRPGIADQAQEPRTQLLLPKWGQF